MPYIDVIEKIIDTKDVTVGGGSASAISGAMGAGLIGMVARLSTKKDYGLTSDQYIKIAEELDLLSKALLDGSEEDTKAYLLIKNAYSMPKSTDEEKKERSTAIQDAGFAAASVPKNNAYNCKRVYDLGMKLIGKSNDAAYSDLIIGINLVKLGIEGCLLNVEANLPLIKREELKEGFEKHIKILRD